MSNTLGLVKLAGLAICCAAGVGMTQAAHADSFSIGYSSGGYHGNHHWRGGGHARYGLSIGLGSGYYGGYYAPRYYAPRYYAPVAYYYPPAPYYPAYGYGYDDAYYAAPAYYGRDYYNPGVSYGISYYGGGRDWDRDGRRWRRGDGDGDRDDRQAGGWDRHHYHNGSGTNWHH